MRISTILLVLLTFLGVCAQAQLSNLSPYSRFGLGDIYQGGNIGTYGLGGVRSTFNDPFLVNSENPASYAYLFNTTFQAGARMQQIRLSEGDQQQELGGGNLDQFQIGFKRVGSKMGFALGITPFSTSGYQLTSETEEEAFGTATYRYDGNGGLNKALVGVARRFELTEYRYWRDKNGTVYDSLNVVTHSLAIGLNMNYFFGNISQTRVLDFNDITYLDTRAVRNTRLFDFGYELGLMYQTTLNARYDKDKHLLSRWMFKAGIIYAPELELNTSIEESFEQTVTQSDVIFPVDTSYYVSGEGRSNLPQRLRFGLALQYENTNGRTFLIGADIEQRDWTRFRTVIDGQEIVPNLTSSNEFSLGFQYTPKPADEDASLLARTQYRFGVRSTETYIVVDGEQIIDEAFSFGMSLPLLSSRSASKFHFGIEFGSRGMNEGTLIKEDYMNLHVGVSLAPFYRNVWFVQRKYE